MLENISDFVKNRDVFAYQFQIKFDKRDGTHSTMFGGTCSLLIRLLMILYIVRLFWFIVSGEEDEYFIFKEVTSDDYNVTSKQLNMVFFFYLYYWDEDGVKRNLDYNDVTRTHIRVGFTQGKTNYSKSDEADYHESINFLEAEPCTEKHFTVKSDPDNEHLSKDVIRMPRWSKRQALCMSDKSKVRLLGTSQSAYLETLQFKIMRCHDDLLGPSDKKCINGTDNDKFISRVGWEFWVKEEKDDF